MISVAEKTAEGNTAEIFTLTDGRVLKLFKEYFSRGDAEYEYRNMTAVNGCSFPKPIAYELVEYRGRMGIVMDKIVGKSLLQRLFGGEISPEECGKVLAEVHKQIFEADGFSDGLGSIKAVLSRNISANRMLSDEEKNVLLKKLERMPNEARLCHGDFHPDNIIIGDDGKRSVIDMMNVCVGDPQYDIARTIYLVKLSPLSPETPQYEMVLRAKTEITDSYIRALGNAYDEEKCREWLPLVLAARGGESPSECENAMKIYRELTE